MIDVKRWYLLLAVMALSGCAAEKEGLVVKQFYLRDQADSTSEEALVRGEKLRRLYGAVSMQERRERLGQYYTVLWDDPAGAGSGPVEVLFEYQQGATASLVKRSVQRFSSDQSAGKAEFSVIGDNYFTHGKVIAWKVSLKRAGKVLNTRQSYLWR
jgi:hypothetical protein